MVIIEKSRTVGMTLLIAACNGVFVGTIGLLYGYGGPDDLPTNSWAPRLHHMPQSFWVSTPGSTSAVMLGPSNFLSR